MNRRNFIKLMAIAPLCTLYKKNEVCLTLDEVELLAEHFPEYTQIYTDMVLGVR